jgi:hypothetical protein
VIENGGNNSEAPQTIEAQCFFVKADASVNLGRDQDAGDLNEYADVEIATRVITEPDEQSFGQIYKALRTVRQEFRVILNWTTGLHVNISKVGGLTVEEMKRVSALYILLEDHLEQLVPAQRRGTANKHVASRQPRRSLKRPGDSTVDPREYAKS